MIAHLELIENHHKSTTRQKAKIQPCLTDLLSKRSLNSFVRQSGPGITLERKAEPPKRFFASKALPLVMMTM